MGPGLTATGSVCALGAAPAAMHPQRAPWPLGSPIAHRPCCCCLSVFHLPSDLRLFCVDMRNTYTTLHDLLLKNEERINNPNLEGESGRNRRHAFA